VKTQVAATSLAAYHSTAARELSRREAEIMILFGDDSVVMSRKQIWEVLRENFGNSAPGEGGVCGRVNALVAAGRLVDRGERVDDHTRKLQQLVGLPARGQQSLFQ
jgi:hypothetical protein